MVIVEAARVFTAALAQLQATISTQTRSVAVRSGHNAGRESRDAACSVVGANEAAASAIGLAALGRNRGACHICLLRVGDAGGSGRAAMTTIQDLHSTNRQLKDLLKGARPRSPDWMIVVQTACVLAIVFAKL
jgi:hypothetical protein